jgi:uncharacterized protein (DUF952 family)
MGTPPMHGGRTPAKRADAVNEPDEILHLALPSDWRAAREAGEYRISTRGCGLDQIGFIHCSYPTQLVGVANRFYADLTELVVLHIEADLLDAPVKLEPATDDGGELFPHVYGPIPTAAVAAETWWDRGDDGLWHKPRSW